MPLVPGYGDTPVPEAELAALLPHVIQTLPKPITRAAIYDLELSALSKVGDLMISAGRGALTLGDLLDEYFLRDLHVRLYGDIWAWAGRWRLHDVNIGVAPEQIAIELRTTLENIQYRWDHTKDWTPRQIGIAAHADTVRIHPFTDGNGRTTRLLADLVFIAAQDPAEFQYDWDIDKRRYIELLRDFDQHRDATDLAAFVDIQPIEESSG